MPSLLACSQNTQTPLWGCLVPLAPPQWWCCQVTPPAPGLPPFEWVLPSNHVSWKGRCEPEGIKWSCDPHRSPRFCEIHGLKSLTWRRQFFCCQPYSGLPFQAHPKPGPCEQLNKAPCKGMCSAHFRRSAAQCAGSEVTGILPLASMLVDQNLRWVVSACSPGTPVSTPKEPANGNWRIQVHATKFKSIRAVPMEKKCEAPQIKRIALQISLLCFGEVWVRDKTKFTKASISPLHCSQSIIINTLSYLD